MDLTAASRRRLFVASCTALTATAVTFAIRGDILGDLGAAFALSNEDLGKAAGAWAYGFSLSIFIGGQLVDLLGMRRIMLAAFLMHVLGVVLTLLAGGFWMLFAGTLAVGLGNGLVEAFINPLTATVYADRKTEKLNLLHVWFPGGIVIGGLLSYLLTLLGLGWRVKMASILVPIFLYGALFLGQEFPPTERVAQGVSTGGMYRAILRPLFFVIVFCMILTASTELATNQWIAYILSSTAGMAAGGILVLVWINGLMAIGRWFAGPMVDRLSPVGLLIGSAAVSAIGLLGLSAATSPPTAIAAATVFAVGICYFWPTMLGVTSERFPDGGALALAIVGGMGTLSVAIFTWILGGLYDRLGPRMAVRYMAVLPIVLIAIFSAIWMSDRRRRRVAVVALTCAVAAILGARPALAAGPIGEFDEHADVGSPRLAGSAAYNAVSQDYTLTAAGKNMWADRDEFQFAWKRMKGDFILQARVEFVGTGVDPHRKLGWIVRQSLDPDSPYADAAVHGDGLTSLQYRRTKGAVTEETRSTITGADFVQLERKGGEYVFSAARFGDPLTVTRVADVALGDDVFVGLFLCSHNPDVVETGIFHDVRIIRPAREGFVPYRDYIGSQLEILEVATGRRRVVHRAAEPFEAPNWTRDGAALIFNTSGRGEGRGRLVRFDLATRRTTPIDTGTANRNNNDHVLSFDGTMIGISDQSAPGGGSTVYTVPVGGGTPKRITAKTPSYLHGWSPDGRVLVYTGGRDDEFDIYAMRSDGTGVETRLTDVKGLDDGPEFSPDGRFIYFNSVRSGTMQIWRMKPDGSAPEQVTSDDSNDWFPHFSPDGKWIAFLSFGKDVSPSDHPYYKRVLLRLMPAAGGPAKVIAYIYGGQGTINVPSWSPDGTMLAFVSNSDLAADGAAGMAATFRRLLDEDGQADTAADP